MSKVLINSVREVEKWKQAIPVMERMVELGGWYYIAGSLCLNIPCPLSGNKFMTINIMPIDDTESEILQHGQYLASRIFIDSGKTGSSLYPQAQKNIEIYEVAHGRELEPSGTVEIN